MLVTSVGHAFHQQDDSSPSTSLDYIIDSADMFGMSNAIVLWPFGFTSSYDITGGTSQPQIKSNLQDDFTLGLSVPSGLQFRLQPPPGFAVNIAVDMTWCAEGTLSEDQESTSSFVTTSTSIALHNVRNLEDEIVDFFQVPLNASYSSKIIDNGRCFTLQAMSLDLGSKQITFDGLSITLHVEGLNDTAITTYTPLTQDGGVMIQYIPLSAPDHRSPVHDPGIGLFINDNQPPKIVNCPANVVATAPNGHL